MAILKMMAHNIMVSNLIGMGVGIFSVCAAIYLQLLAKRFCDPKYITAYFLIGAALIFTNMEVVTSSTSTSETITIMVYLTIFMGEVYYGYKVYKSSKKLPQNHETVAQRFEL